MENWIILNSTTGNSGETQITLQVAENTNYSARTTTLTVRTRSKNLTDTVVINQQAKAATGQMTFNPSALSYTYEGGTIPFSITANEEWRVVSWPTWVGISGDGTSGGTGTYNWGVTALRNYSESDLDSTFTFYCGGNYFTVPVHQDAYSEQPTGSTEYLTFEIISGGTIYWKTTGNAHTVEYQINGGSWNSITSSTGGTPITVSAGDIVKWRGDNSNYNSSSFSGTTAEFKAKGNIMSLIDSDDFSSLVSLNNFAFTGLFNYCTGLTDASELELPATTLAYACYREMFKGCSSLTNAPVLSATILADSCYDSMFQGCSNLTTAPELPATTLASACYSSMFQGCTSLTAAPALPATTLEGACYYQMFANCSSLTTAPALSATTLATACYSNMFRGCTSLTTVPSNYLPVTTLAQSCYDSMFYNCTGLTTAPELPATTLENNCYLYMFHGCSNLTTAPALPATTLANYCYAGMFYACTGLTTAPELPATTLANYCYYEMFSGCRSLTTAPVLPATTLTTWCYEEMFDGCFNLNYIKCLATDISASDCTSNWVNAVAPTGTFVKADSMTGWTIDSVNGIPIGWTVINASDENPDYSIQPMTFEILSSGNIVFSHDVNRQQPAVIEYSKNNGEWTEITSTSGGTRIPVALGDVVKFRGNENYYSHTFFSGTTCQFKMYGNIMSLVDASNYSTLTTLTRNAAFYMLFYSTTGLTDASNLVLPATTLTQQCYDGMFSNCINLTAAPLILPATNLARLCYEVMFKNCTSLTRAPELPATTLVDDCYEYMFSGCSNLNYVKCLATTVNYSTSSWLAGTSIFGTFVKNPAMNDWSRDVHGIPSNWTVVDAT